MMVWLNGASERLAEPADETTTIRRQKHDTTRDYTQDIQIVVSKIVQLGQKSTSVNHSCQSYR